MSDAEIRELVRDGADEIRILVELDRRGMLSRGQTLVRPASGALNSVSRREFRYTFARIRYHAGWFPRGWFDDPEARRWGARTVLSEDGSHFYSVSFFNPTRGARGEVAISFGGTHGS